MNKIIMAIDIWLFLALPWLFPFMGAKDNDNN